MTVAQKVPFELVPSTAPPAVSPSRRSPPRWRTPSKPSPASTGRRLLVFGGWESALRGAGATCKWSASASASRPVPRRGPVHRQRRRLPGNPRTHRRRQHQVSTCAGAARPARLGHRQFARAQEQSPGGMVNMRMVMPALQKAKPANSPPTADFAASPAQAVARDADRQRPVAGRHRAGNRGLDQEIIIKSMETILLLAHTEPGGSLAKPALEALHAAARADRRPPRLPIHHWAPWPSRAGPRPTPSPLARPRHTSASRRRLRPFPLRHRRRGGGSICSAAQATVVLAPATARWIARCRVWRSGWADASTPTSPAWPPADGKISLNRWYYRQRMEGTLTRAQRPWSRSVDWSSRYRSASLAAVNAFTS